MIKGSRCRDHGLWPVVDFDGRRKPSWYATRRAFADHTVVFDTTGDELSLVVVNDTREGWTDTAQSSVVTSTGAVHRHEFAVTVPADGTSRVAIAGSVGSAGVVGACALVADVGAARRLHLVPGSTVPKAPWTVDVQPRDGGAGVIVTAATLVTDLCLFADRLHPSASVDSQLVHLLPGESHRFEVDAVAVEIDWSQAGTRPVLRSSNDR